MISFGLDTIRMNEKGEVNPEDQKIHEKNLAWLNLLIKGEMKEIQKQVLEEVKALTKSFELPDGMSVSGGGSKYKMLSRPEIMKTNVQKVTAYQNLKKACPEAVSLVEADPKLKENMRLLSETTELLLDDAKTTWGLDFSGDEFQVVKPAEKNEKQKEDFKKKRDQYDKDRKEFGKSQK